MSNGLKGTDERIVGTIPKTKNGVIILDRKPATGKAAGQIIIGFMPWNRFTPFVTYWMRDDGETFGGDYCETLTKAVDSFKGRVS